MRIAKHPLPAAIGAAGFFRLGVLFLLLSSTGIMQGQYLNEKYYRSKNAKIALDRNDSIYLIASLNNSKGPHSYEYTAIGHNGKVIDSLDLLYPDSTTWLDNCINCLHIRDDAIYNGYTDFLGLPPHDSSVVIFSKISPDLQDTLYTKKYLGGNSRGPHVWAMEFDSDSTFLASGYIGYRLNDSVVKYDLFLSRFDTAFNLLWETRVADSVPGRQAGPIGTDIVIDQYGGILVTGNHFEYTLFLRMGFAARFDAVTGQSLWYREYQAPLGINGMYCADRGDGSYQFVQNWIDDPTSSVNLLKIGIMDTMGNILQSRKYGRTQKAQFATDLIPTLDGNYYTAGVSYFGNYHGFGLKFTSDLDSLWMHRYWYEDTVTAHTNFIETFLQEPDSGFIHAGYHTNRDFQDPEAGLYAWLLGTDKYGCKKPGCYTISLPEYARAVSMALYPNPAREKVMLKWDPGKLAGANKLNGLLISTSGQVVRHYKNIEVPSGSQQLNLEGLDKGRYLLEIRPGEGGHILSIHKLVIE